MDYPEISESSCLGSGICYIHSFMSHENRVRFNLVAQPFCNENTSLNSFVQSVITEIIHLIKLAFGVGYRIDQFA